MTNDRFLAEKAWVVRTLAQNIEHHTLHTAIEIGKHLHDVRTELSRRGGAHEGKWLRWSRREFNWTDQTARNLINLFDAFGSNPKRVLDCHLPLRALYKLAAPSTPEAARVEVIGRLEAGERLQHPEVTAIIATHTSQQEKTEDRTVAGPEPQAEPNPEPEAVELSVSAAPELKSEPAPQVLEQISQGAQQEQVVTLRRPIQDLKAELAEALRERDAARKQAEQFQRELAGAREEIQSLHDQLAEARKQRDELRERGGSRDAIISQRQLEKIMEVGDAAL
jgi:hypothetical protein